MCALTGSNVTASAIPAILSDHRRVKFKGRSYPSVVRSIGFEVVGMVHTSLDALAWRTIDAYEGVEFVLVDACVRTLLGEELEVKMFVVRDEFVNLLLEEDWDFELWQTNSLAKAVSDCVEFRFEVETARKREFLHGLVEAKFEQETMLMRVPCDKTIIDIEAAIRL